MATTLEQILAATRLRVEQAKRNVPMAQLERQAAEHSPRGFADALRSASRHGVAIIAELKKASPSKGLIRASFRPAGLAAELANSGAAALSVLTEENFFQGSLDYLLEASAAVEIPILRKDFILDEYQLLEARAYHADAVLLIVAALGRQRLRDLYQRACALGLDVLCEVHEERELEIALDAGVDIIGVNNRNLHTFEVDLNTSVRLASRISGDKLRVAESGINSPADITALRSIGFDAFLIGESLMRADHPGQVLTEFLQRRTAAQ